MNTKSPDNIQNTPTFYETLIKIWDWISNFFKKNPENKRIVADLCSGLPQFARECQKNKVISDTWWFLNKFKKTIT